jgi:hypothetical protein
VNPDDLRSGAAAGFIAATATAGTLIAIGMRTSNAARPFNLLAAHVVGGFRADVWGFVATVTLAGILYHLVVTTAIGAFASLMVRRTALPVWVVSFAVAFLCCLISIGVARRGGESIAQIFSLGDIVVYYLVLALALTAGIWFAFPRAARRSSSDMPEM